MSKEVIAQQMLEYRCKNDREDTLFYLGCDNFEMEFNIENGHHASKMSFCQMRQPLDCKGRVAAEQIASEKNAAGGSCPVCGKKVKYKAYSEADFGIRALFVNGGMR